LVDALSHPSEEAPAMNPIILVLGILYVLSPIDFIPDVIPVIGWLDDIGVLGYLGYSLLKSK
jgi:uncharacterized membrane protein YkvA (DUF1232 family)